MVLMAMLGATHALFPHLRPWIRKFYAISYYDAATGLYSKGPDDLYLVFFWIVLFTFLRSTVLDYVFVPLARMGGITTRKGVVRFSEQAWLVVYYGAFWGVGLVSSESCVWSSSKQKLTRSVGHASINCTTVRTGSTCGSCGPTGR